MRYNSLNLLDELTREEDVLEWLVQNKSTGDEDDVIEDITAKSLKTLVDSVDHLAVLFCKFLNLFKKITPPVAKTI